MAINFTLTLALDGGAQLKIEPQASASASNFMKMSLIAPDESVVASSNITQVEGSKFLRQLQYLHAGLVSDLV